MNSNLLSLDAAVFVGALLLTLGIRSFARKRGLVAHPNERSSHVQATPHGGGLAVMLMFLAALAVLYRQGAVAPGLTPALLCVVPIVIVGQIDDIIPVPARIRLLVQALCTVAGLYFLGGVDTLAVGGATLHGWWLNLPAALYVIWMTNLYNFIDGIDGYAASETIFVGLASTLLFADPLGTVLAAAAAGFLVFNWHKASIFMGDVGSAPLGFVFAVLSLSDAAAGTFAGWLVLLSLFWFDATVTLWRRFRAKEVLSAAHRKHAYQRLVQSGWSHDRVVLGGMALNLLLFVLLWFTPENAYGGVLVVALVLLYAAMKYVDSRKRFA